MGHGFGGSDGQCVFYCYVRDVLVACNVYVIALKKDMCFLFLSALVCLCLLVKRP